MVVIGSECVALRPWKAGGTVGGGSPSSAFVRCGNSGIVSLCRVPQLAGHDNSILVVDGGDFVGTAAYLVQPRGPLCWLVFQRIHFQQ